MDENLSATVETCAPPDRSALDLIEWPEHQRPATREDLRPIQINLLRRARSARSTTDLTPSLSIKRAL